MQLDIFFLTVIGELWESTFKIFATKTLQEWKRLRWYKFICWDNCRQYSMTMNNAQHVEEDPLIRNNVPCSLGDN